MATMQSSTPDYRLKAMTMEYSLSSFTSGTLILINPCLVARWEISATNTDTIAKTIVT
jgi:hypothetical protein